ncbi:DivIVA domain-containing protein [Cryobacterium sp. TMT1-3]|uniref:DivIVA domain-containing protein n=1 Tax=Cryobacterium luteum TaxID=1424661 RepID=A0A1H8EUE8_9MICO|nr:MULTISPECIES: DivIVA domain-containing protein [Cryobacterium]TFB85412.1 DivIVA domain-containing protein [Cryobacterium luteum]TFC26683.1 DivIVA domain-containing protein [Cryobacterium sp. TMT1-3]SEN23112.1 DivIVA domain-containing protein [Cryobacterium luteum]
MSTIFPRVGKKTLGYNVGQVEAFLAAARRAYDQPEPADDDLDADTGSAVGTVESVDAIAAAAEPDVHPLQAVPGDPTAGADGTDAIHAIVAEKAEAEAAVAGATLTAEGIRHTAFAMHKGGFSPEHVDAALERLEDAFAARERFQSTSARGEQAWMADAETTADLLVARLSRPPGHRFTRASVLAVGYKRVDVDRLANKLVKYFQDGRELTVDEVRTSVFRPERGGYREAQVDLVLDSVVDVMLAVR